MPRENHRENRSRAPNTRCQRHRDVGG
jgi:hypothetical protein